MTDSPSTKLGLIRWVWERRGTYIMDMESWSWHERFRYRYDLTQIGYAIKATICVLLNLESSANSFGDGVEMAWTSLHPYVSFDCYNAARWETFEVGRGLFREWWYSITDCDSC